MSDRFKLLFSFALPLLLAGAALAASVDGAWTAKMEGRQGRSLEVTFHLKADGDKLTGDVSAMGGQQEIADGSVQGDKVSFKVVREMQGRSITMRYEGKVSGDEIKFKQSVEGMDRPAREFTAKRAN